MENMEFAQHMQQRGCMSDGQNYYGNYKGYPFTVTFISGSQAVNTVFSLSFQFSKMVSGTLFKAVNQQVGDAIKLATQPTATDLFAIKATTLNEGVGGGQALAQAFDALMESIVSNAAGLGITVPETCPLCKQGNCDSYAFVGSSYRPVHEQCVRASSQHTQAQVQKNVEQGSVGLGIVGAVIGAIVGAIPTVLIIAFAEYIIAFLCALIPLGAYFGYKLFRGKMGAQALVVVIIVSIIMAPITQYMTVLVGLLSEGYDMISPFEYLDILINYPGDVLPSLLQTLLFIGLGFAIVFGIVKKTNSTTLNQVTYSEATLSPIAQTAAQDSPQPSQPYIPPTNTPGAPM
jgi:hypothetical protein